MKQENYLEIIELNKGKHRQPVETLIQGRKNKLFDSEKPVETRLVAKFNVTDISNPTRIINPSNISQFSEIEIDGIIQPSIVATYQFNIVGDHSVKYTLKDKTSIDESAFGNCSNLISITIPDSVTSIGQTAFSGCSRLTNITIGSGVTNIGIAAFQYCTSLTEITIPNNVKNLNVAVFYNCTGLTSVEIGNGVTSIGSQVFYNCSNLFTITSHIMNAPSVPSITFYNVKNSGTLYVPIGSSGYETWMNDQGNLGYHNWTKVEQ